MRSIEHHYIPVLYKYWDVFPGMLPTCAPPNQKLGNIHEIPLVEGAELVKKSHV